MRQFHSVSSIRNSCFIEYEYMMINSITFSIKRFSICIDCKSNSSNLYKCFHTYSNVCMHIINFLYMIVQIHCKRRKDHTGQTVQEQEYKRNILSRSQKLAQSTIIQQPEYIISVSIPSSSENVYNSIHTLKRRMELNIHKVAKIFVNFVQDDIIHLCTVFNHEILYQSLYRMLFIKKKQLVYDCL